MYKKNIIFILCALFCTISAVDIGSDTAPARFDAIQVLNTGDRIAGFAAIEGGFKLFDSTTTGTWDSFFAASGQISLREGTLFLNKDLLLRNVSSIETIGNIDGNNRAIELLGTGGIIPARDTNCAIEFVALDSPGAVTNLSSDWFSDNEHIAFAFFTGGFSGVAVENFDGASLTLLTFILNLDGGSSTQTNSVRCHPTLPVCAVVRDQSTGDELFSVVFIESGPTLTVLDSDGAAGNFVACAWHPAGEFLAVGTTVAGSQLRVYPFDTGTGLFGVPSTLAIVPARNIQRESMDWNVDGTLLAVGVEHTGANPDLLVYEYDINTNTLTLNASTVVDTGADVLSVSWNKQQPNFIAIGIEGGFTESVFLYEHDEYAGTLSVRGDGITDLNSTEVQTVHFSPDGNCLGVGRGVFAGTGAVRTYAFDNPIFNQTFDLNTAGAVALTSFRYSPDGQYQVTSQDGGTMILAAFERLTSTAIPTVSWTDLDFSFDQDVILRNSTIILNGTNQINGKSGRLTLEDSVQLLVGSNATLTLKDITLRGINDSNIHPIDNTGNIIFDNARMILDGDYTFTLGYFEVQNTLILEGNGHTFNFETDQVCTVTSNARLILRDGITFNYNPSIASKTLLRLNDETSSLLINGSTLSTNSAGLELARGSLFIEGKSIFNNGGSIVSQAIDLGDGTIQNNLNIEFLPAAQLIVDQGFLRNRNV